MHPCAVDFFAWLALQNRVWTSDRLARRGLPHQERCPFCDQDVETINHLLIRCVFARETWDAVCQAIGIIGEAPTAADDLLAWTTRPALAGRHAKSLRALHLLIMWELWKHRNSIVFEGKAPDVRGLLRKIAAECAVWTKAGIIHSDLEPWVAEIGVWADRE